MQSSQSRRRFLATLSSAGVAGLMGTGTPLARTTPVWALRDARVPIRIQSSGRRILGVVIHLSEGPLRLLLDSTELRAKFHYCGFVFHHHKPVRGFCTGQIWFSVSPSYNSPFFIT